MDPPLLLLQGGETQNDDDLHNEDAFNSDSDYARHHNLDQLHNIDFNAPDEDLLTNIREQLTATTPSTQNKKSTKTTTNVCKSAGNQAPSGVGPKRRKKMTTGAQMYNDHLALVEQTSQKMLNMFEAEAASSAAPREKCTVQQAVDILEEMVKEGLLEEDSTLWCFATIQLMNDSFRHMFVTIPRHKGRLASLKYQYREMKGVEP